MIEELKKRVREIIVSQEAQGFLGLVENSGHPIPTLISSKNLDDCERLTITEVRYPLVGILTRLHRRYPDQKLAVMVRGCEERALIEIAKNDQLKLNLIVLVGINCSESLARQCRCSLPFTSFPGLGERITHPQPNRSDIIRIEELTLSDRLTFWRNEFERCIRCYGCRNICPMCFCQNCTLEDQEFLGRGEVPPRNPGWHLLRALHMAGRCIDCGLCEEACPMNIPLRTLYRKVREIGKETLGYLPGDNPDQKPPLEILGDGNFDLPPLCGK